MLAPNLLNSDEDDSENNLTDTFETEIDAIKFLLENALLILNYKDITPLCLDGPPNDATEEQVQSDLQTLNEAKTHADNLIISF